MSDNLSHSTVEFVSVRGGCLASESLTVCLGGL